MKLITILGKIMNEKDTVLFNNWKQSLSIGQQKNYLNKIKTILEIYSSKQIFESPELIDNIEKFNTVSKKEMAWTSLSNFLKFNNKYSEKIKQKVNDSIKTRKDKEKQTSRIVYNFKDLDQKWKKIPENTLESLTAKVLFDLYLHYPPLRSDILMVKYKNHNKEEPYLELKKKKIVIGNCIKTKKKIPDILLNEESLRLLSIFLPQIEGDYIIPMSKEDEKRISNGTPSKFFSRLTEKYLDQKITINDFRKTAVDRIESETKFMSPRIRIQKFLDLGEGMGHSYAIQQQYYNINDDHNLEFKIGNLNLSGEQEYAETEDYIIIKKKL